MPVPNGVNFRGARAFFRKHHIQGAVVALVPGTAEARSNVGATAAKHRRTGIRVI